MQKLASSDARTGGVFCFRRHMGHIWGKKSSKLLGGGRIRDVASLIRRTDEPKIGVFFFFLGGGGGGGGRWGQNLQDG